jgi:arsenate reductase (thioredoxin)
MLPKIAFICTHNACRSQIAEAFGKHLAFDLFESYSAGTEIKQEVNETAVRLLKQRYNIDIEHNRPKLLSELPPVDIVITMGCGVQCPFLPCKYREDWGIEDPTGKPDAEFIQTIEIIKQKVAELKNRLRENRIAL